MFKYVLPFLVSLSIVSYAGAQDATTTATSTKVAPQRTREQIRTIKEDTKSNIRDIQEGLKKEVQGIKQTIQTQVKTATRTPATLRELQKKREEFREEIEQKREEAQEKIRAAREDLRERLEKVKDEQKKQRVERIAEEIDALNERVLKHYLETLEKMERMLERIAERANRAESRGIEVSVVRSAVDGAYQAIEASREAIRVQAEKTYTIEVNLEERLKADVGKTRQALHADLVKVRDTVRAAHNAVRNAAVILAQIPRIDDDGAATSTPPVPPPSNGTTTATSSQ